MEEDIVVPLPRPGAAVEADPLTARSRVAHSNEFREGTMSIGCKRGLTVTPFRH